jgi:hypothetical protein
MRSPLLLATSCAAAAWAATGGLLRTAPLEALHGPFPVAEALKARAGPSEGRWRLLTTTEEVVSLKGAENTLKSTVGGAQALHPYYNSLAGVEGVPPYTSLPDLDYDLLWTSAPRAAAQLFGVRFAVTISKDLDPGVAERLGYHRGPLLSWIKEFPQQPRAFLAGCALSAASRADAAARMAARSFDPHHTAVLLGRSLDLPCKAPSQPFDVARPAPDHMRLEVQSAERSILLVGEHFDPGWSAVVDGRPAPVLRVDLAALGVELLPGKHLVELRYFSPGLWAGLALALGTAVLFGLLSLRSAGTRSPRWSRRSRTSSTAPN